MSKSSNDWKILERFFQWLEVSGAAFPMVGSFPSVFANDWKQKETMLFAACMSTSLSY
jgi:hypothetical protein